MTIRTWAEADRLIHTASPPQKNENVRNLIARQPDRFDPLYTESRVAESEPEVWVHWCESVAGAYMLRDWLENNGVAVDLWQDQSDFDDCGAVVVTTKGITPRGMETHL